MERTKRPDTRRQELLEAALHLFVEQGIAATTVEDVTLAAGAAKGTFYRYFRSKEVLLAAVREEFEQQVAEVTQAAATQIESHAAQLAALLTAGMEYYRDHLAVHDALFHTGETGSLMSSTLVRQLQQRIEAGVAGGAFVVADPALTAGLLFAAAHAAVDDYRAGDRQPWDRYIAAVEDLAARVVGGRAQKQRGTSSKQ
jgi:AcrR family transcriptional regulator